MTHYHRPVENFAFSAGVSYEHQGGFFRNHALGGHHADRGDDLSARWRGIFLPSDLFHNFDDIHGYRTFCKTASAAYAAEEAVVVFGIVNELVHKSLTESLFLGESVVPVSHFGKLGIHT